MRKGFLASVAALAAGTGLATAQGPGYPADPAPLGMSAAPYPGPGGPGGPGGPAPLPPGAIPPATDIPHNGVSGYASGGCDAGSAPRQGLFGHQGATGGQVHQHAGGPDCFFFDVEGMYWLFRPQSVRVPLLSVGPLGSTGAIGEAGVTVLEGNENYGMGAFAGLKLNLGIWDQQRVWGFNLGGFLTEERAEIDEYTFPVTGRRVLARPITDVLTGANTSVLVAFPAVNPNAGFSGGAITRISSRLGGADVNLLRSFIYEDRIKLHGIFGYRFTNLDEQVRVDSLSVLPSAIGLPDDIGTRYIFDNFQTHNQFHGGQVGFDLELRRGRFYVDTVAKFAVGVQHQVLNVEGQTSTNISGVITNTAGGVLALESNSFRQIQNDFCFVPEVNVKLGYNFTQRISGHIGYNVLYMSSVVRPGDQITNTVNPTTLPSSLAFNPQLPFGPPAPVAKFDKTDFWAQGVNFGLSFKY